MQVGGYIAMAFLIVFCGYMLYSVTMNPSAPDKPKWEPTLNMGQ